VGPGNGDLALVEAGEESIFGFRRGGCAAQTDYLGNLELEECMQDVGAKGSGCACEELHCQNMDFP